MRITEFPKSTTFEDGDVLIKDGAAGTKRLESKNLMYALFDDIPQMHRQIYRGKNLGTSVSFQQWKAIETGTFKDLWIGDFWVIGGNTWVITDFNYFLSYEGIDEKPHVVLTRENVLTINILYDKTVPEAIDFYSSNLYSNLKSRVDNTYKKQFNNRLLSYTVFRQPKHTGGLSEKGRYVNDVYITIPTQTQMLGHEFVRTFSDSDYNYQSQTGYGCQFALFELAYPEMIRRYERRGLNDAILLDSYSPNGTVATILPGGYQSYRTRKDNGHPWEMIPTIVIG